MPDATPPGRPDDASGGRGGSGGGDGLAAALARLAAARQAGLPGLVALEHLRTGQLLLAAARPREALAHLDEALGFVAVLRAEGTHEHRRMLRMLTPAAPPPGPGDVDLGLLEGAARVARAEALLDLGDLAGVRAEVEAARPWARGLSRRPLRRRLDAVSRRAAARAGDADAALAEVDAQLRRGGGDPLHAAGLRLRRADALLAAGRPEDAMHEALLVVRDTDPVGGARVVASARQLVAVALSALGRDEEALPSLVAAFDGFRRVQAWAEVVELAGPLAARLQAAGQGREAVACWRAAVEAARRKGDPGGLADTLAGLAAGLDDAGSGVDDVLAAFRDAVEAAEEAAGAAGAPGGAGAGGASGGAGAADARHGLAVVLATRCSHDDEQVVEALSVLDEARAGYTAAGHPERAAGCDHEAGALLARRGARSAAAARYRSALEAYLALPADRRDAGAWPDEVADCEASLAALDAGADAPFASGGHAMRHAPAPRPPAAAARPAGGGPGGPARG